MSRISPIARVALAFAMFSLLLLGCGSAAPSAATPPSTSGSPNSPSPAAMPTTPANGSAEGLCDVFTADLAQAALGGAVATPTGGEVLPRPNGIYCHYAAAGDARVNVEAQLQDMDRAEFDALAETLDTTEPVEGVGEVAYMREGSIMGYPGVTLLAWAGGQKVFVSISRDGDPQSMLAAAVAIAEATLGN